MVKTIGMNVHGYRVLLANQGETWVRDGDYLYFGSDLDVSFQWVAASSLLQILPLTNDIGAVNFGNGTKDMDVKIFLGSATEYALFDVGESRLELAVVGIYFTGTLTTGISFNGASFTPDANRTDIAMSIGSRATELSITMAAAADQNFDPVQFNINVIGANPTSTSTINTIYQKITHDTTAMAALRLKCADWNIAIAKNVLDAYVYQGQIDITAGAGNTVAVGNEACVLGLTMNAGSTGTVTGLVRGLVVLMTGSCLPANAAAVYVNVGGGTTLTHGLLLATQTGTALTNAIYIETAGTLTNVLKFGETSAAVVAISTGGATRSYRIRCAVGGVTGYLSFYTD